MNMPVGQRYPILPLPHIPEQTEMIPAGVLTIGVGHRVLDEDTARAYLDEVGYRRVDADGTERRYEGRDAGVCIHVFGPPPNPVSGQLPGAPRSAAAGADGSSADLVEYVRFDCFDDEPHYHYVYNAERAQDRVFLDPTLEGDPMAWALERLRTRMPEVLRKVGAPDVAERVDPAAMDAAIPAVVAAVDRATQRAAGLPTA
jgi:hypothetical protein